MYKIVGALRASHCCGDLQPPEAFSLPKHPKALTNVFLRSQFVSEDFQNFNNHSSKNGPENRKKQKVVRPPKT